MFMLIQIGVSCKWTNDSQRLLLEYFDIIHDSPSQIYHSVLPFSPSSSWLWQYYSLELSKEVKVVKGLPTGWGMCSRTVRMVEGPWAIACWGNTLAVDFVPRGILILNAVTGSKVTVLSGHVGSVQSLAFSSDGSSLVSGGYDTTVKLWDMQTGGIVKTFCGHTQPISSVSVSSDCTMIASGSGDMTIRLWDIQRRACHYVIEQHEQVFCVRFSPINPQHLISVSGDEVQQWDTNGHQINHACNGSRHVAFSSDGTLFVSCTLVHTAGLVVQNSNSGAVVAELHTPNGTPHHCCFSPDDKLIATVVDAIIYIWDIAGFDPCLVETFVGHTRTITSLAFSSPSSIISSSHDESVKFWQIGIPSTDLVMTDSESISLASAPMKSVTLQGKDGIVISSDSNGVVRTWDISTGLCKQSFQTPAKDPYQRDVQWINSKLILVWCADKKIYIWDVEKGELIQTADGLWDVIRDVKISGDGSKVFCLNWSCVQISSIWTGELVAKIKHRRIYADSLIVDGSKVWVHSHIQEQEYKEPLGWDFGFPDSPPIQLPNSPLLHLDDTKLWDFHLSKMEDKITGKVVFRLGGKFAKVLDVQSNGWYLVARYHSGEILVLDFNNVLLQ